MSYTKQGEKTVGYASEKAGDKLSLIEYTLPQLGPMDVLVNISHCGICHSDLHLLSGEWGAINRPAVAGHEIVGHIAKRGTSVTELPEGARVGIGWLCDSCHACEWCHSGEDNLCLTKKATCVDGKGGFSKHIVVDSRFAYLLPDALDSATAAPLLCGGATVFSPMLRYNINSFSKVGVIGIGGLGHLALQFAHALGAEVYAISHSAEKEEEAKKFGAHHFLLSSDIKKAKGKLDFILSTVSAGSQTEELLALLRPKGVLCFVGAPQEKVDALIVNMIAGEKTICGSNVISGENMKRMLSFAARYKIAPLTEIFAFDQVNEALLKLEQGHMRYRAVLKW
ncbi:MAG: NAD(P)-dependent alcohol dehydrogenase [Chlamydiales bacterium]|nr:NAD(P)-dependent alcohol dehydrogenase [Chlamydiales bacterium]